MTSHVLENMSEAITNNYSNYHQAVDIVGSGNSIDDVIAVGDGVVEMVVKDVKYTNHNTSGTATYGNFVKIKHESGKKTLYAHLKYGSVTVDKGQTVSKGEKIGTMGETGNAYGTHLHFEVRNADETRENPNDYLNGSKTVEVEKVEEPKEDNQETPEVIEEPTEIVSETEEVQNDDKLEDSEDSDDEYEEKIIDEEPIQELEESTSDEVVNTKSNVIHGVIYADDETDDSDNSTILENSDYYGGSIVDGLKGINVDSSFDNRAIIALKNGINGYRGTYEQNVYLLRLLKQGKLKA